MQKVRTNHGFSLFQILAFATILGAILALVVWRMNLSKATSKTKVWDHRKAINAAVERYYMDHNAWPANDLRDIGANARYFPDGMPKNPEDGSAYTLNATTHRVN